jgi:nucleoside-diphosphate-sugar epimerase
MAVSGKKIVITGGAGFIGTSMAKLLADDNDLVLFDNMTNDALAQTELADHPNVTFISGDVLDHDAFSEAAEGANIIIHMAAIAGVDSVLKSPVRTMRVNLLGTANVVDVAAANMGTLERFIDFSTSEVFGKHAYKVEETHEMSGGKVGEARWTYAVSKLAGEYLAHSYFDEIGLPVSVVRPFNIYGPNQVGVGAIHHFTVRALRGEDLIIHGDGSQIRAWCYIDDILSALMRILEVPAAIGQAFNIGNPRSVCTTYDLAQRILRITGSDSQLVHKPLHYSDVEIRIPDVTKSRELLTWEPMVDLDDGLTRTMSWYREQLAVPV